MCQWPPGSARFLLDAGAQIEAKHIYGGTPLGSASQEGSIEIVSLLLARGAAVGARSNGGWTTLIHACHSGHAAVARELLVRGVDVNARDEDGWTALHLASNAGHLDAARVLLECPDIDVRLLTNLGHSARQLAATTELHEELGVPRLHWACGAGLLSLAVSLIERGANIEGIYARSTPLHQACCSGHVDVARELLRRGASLEARGSSGNTPLTGACKHGHVGVVRLLLDAGAQLETTNDLGETPLFAASSECGTQGEKVRDYVAIVRELLVRGAATNTRATAVYQDANLPLLVASRDGHAAIVRELIAGGADKNARGLRGKTALHFASKSDKGSADTVRELLKREHGADAVVDARDDEGRTALHAAAGNVDKSEVVHLLVARGADINARQHDGATALICACTVGADEIVRILLAREGIDARIETNAGVSALRAAEERLEWRDGDYDHLMMIMMEPDFFVAPTAIVALLKAHLEATKGKAGVVS